MTSKEIEREAEDFRERVQAIYKALERKEESRGALAWFARLAGVGPYSVSRWAGGKNRSPIPGPVKALLRELEKRVELERMLRGNGG